MAGEGGGERVKETAWDAFIMIVDIVKFSESPQHRQVAMVRFLIEELIGTPWMTSREGLPRLLNSTGDGFLLAIPTTGPLDLPLSFCETAAHFVQRARTFRPEPFEVRVGVHRGDVVSGLEAKGVGFAVGIGLNWCARVASLAEPSQILISERFFKQALQQVGPDPLSEKVDPPPLNSAFELVVKHGRPAKVRTWITTIPTPAIPRQLAADHQLSEHIDNALKIIGSSVASALEALAPDLTPKALQLRLSLWVPRGEFMVRLPFEHHVGDGSSAAPQHAAPRRPTRYRHNRGCALPPEGPVAQAFVDGRCVLLLDLPDPATHENDYLSRLELAGIPRSVVQEFNRRARSLICVPLPLFNDPSGVLCIDALLHLDEHRVAMAALTDEIKTSSGYFLAALVELRLG